MRASGKIRKLGPLLSIYDLDLLLLLFALFFFFLKDVRPFFFSDLSNVWLHCSRATTSAGAPKVDLYFLFSVFSQLPYVLYGFESTQIQNRML